MRGGSAAGRGRNPSRGGRESNTRDCGGPVYPPASMLAFDTARGFPGLSTPAPSKEPKLSASIATEGSATDSTATSGLHPSQALRTSLSSVLPEGGLQPPWNQEEVLGAVIPFIPATAAGAGRPGPASTWEVGARAGGDPSQSRRGRGSFDCKASARLPTSELERIATSWLDPRSAAPPSEPWSRAVTPDASQPRRLCGWGDETASRWAGGALLRDGRSQRHRPLGHALPAHLHRNSCRPGTGAVGRPTDQNEPP